MIIKPKIRSNFFANAHPIGCREFVKQQIDEAKAQPKFKGPKNVLIIGGSSGYGLASRIALAYGADANTVNVSFETGPVKNRTGTAGWWNNKFFLNFAKETQNIHKDFNGDAFTKALKEDVIKYIKETLGTIDLVVYSLASPVRINEITNELVRSQIKTLGEPAVGQTIDIAKKVLLPLTVEPATEQEVEDTVFVMGGEDWKNWMMALEQHNALSEGVKTISYTYIGGPTTEKIYRKGTLGKAKQDLEDTAETLNQHLASNFQGEALISSSKAVATKASVFIPQMPIYASCLYEVMIAHHQHESILEHKYRLFKDMVYGSGRILDDAKRIRIDHKEMEHEIQHKTLDLMKNCDEKRLFSLHGTKVFLRDVYQLNGFDFDTVDYDQDVDIDALAKQI